MRQIHRVRSVLIAGACILLGPAATSALAAGQTGRPDRIEWSIDRHGTLPAGKVQLTIDSRWEPDSHSIWSNDRPISDLQGLSEAQLSGPSGPARFALVRDSGRLEQGGMTRLSADQMVQLRLAGFEPK